MGAILHFVEKLFTPIGMVVGAGIAFAAYKWFKWMASDANLSDKNQSGGGEPAAPVELAAPSEAPSEPKGD
jgi:hypothetical protein